MSGGSTGRPTGLAASHARPAVRVVELLGPPASGKSSVAAGLAATPGVVVLKEHRRSDLPALASSVVGAWPVLWTRPPAGVGRIRWAAWAGRLGAAPRTVQRRRAPRTVVLLDQGPAYTLGRMEQLRDDPLASDWWQARVDMSAQLLDVLVVLDADAATLAQRLHARPKAHVARTLDEVAAVDYLDGERARCRLVADAHEAAGGRVLRLCSQVTPVAEIVATVAALFETEPAPGEGAHR